MITGDHFCDWDCRSDYKLYYIVALVVSLSLATLFVVYSYLRFYRGVGRRVHWQEHLIYWALLFWGVAYVGFFSFQIGVYTSVFEPLTRGDHPDMTLYSRVNAFWETLPAFTIQTLLIYSIKNMYGCA